MKVLYPRIAAVCEKWAISQKAPLFQDDGMLTPEQWADLKVALVAEVGERGAQVASSLLSPVIRPPQAEIDARLNRLASAQNNREALLRRHGISIPPPKPPYLGPPKYLGPSKPPPPPTMHRKMTPRDLPPFEQAMFRLWREKKGRVDQFMRMNWRIFFAWLEEHTREPEYYSLRCGYSASIRPDVCLSARGDAKHLLDGVREIHIMGLVLSIPGHDEHDKLMRNIEHNRKNIVPRWETWWAPKPQPPRHPENTITEADYEVCKQTAKRFSFKYPHIDPDSILTRAVEVLTRERQDYEPGHPEREKWLRRKIKERLNRYCADAEDILSRDLFNEPSEPEQSEPEYSDDEDMMPDGEIKEPRADKMTFALEQLTPRQQRVAFLMVEYKMTQEGIASRLGVSLSTVRGEQTVIKEAAKKALRRADRD